MQRIVSWIVFVVHSLPIFLRTAKSSQFWSLDIRIMQTSEKMRESPIIMQISLIRWT